MGVKKGFAGMGGGDAGQETDAPKSKTQLKKEKRGSTMKYRWSESGGYVQNELM